jgi:recombination protein RecT
MPEGQTPVADEAEQFEPVWVRPLDALARHRAGQFFMIFPTIRTLERLQHFASVEACWPPAPPPSSRCGRAARARACWPARKRATWSTKCPIGELALVCPDGQIVHALDWQSEQPGAAAAQRAAPDRTQPRRDDRPRHQQLPRGRPATRLHRHRPRPGRPEHLERLWRAAGGTSA